LKAAVDYSVQYIPQRTLPDKAIDLLDMTAAHLAAKRPETDKAKLAAELKQLEADKAEAVEAENYQAAEDLKVRIEKIKTQLENNDQHAAVMIATVDDIAQSVERLTGIPVAKMGAMIFNA